MPTTTEIVDLICELQEEAAVCREIGQIWGDHDGLPWYHLAHSLKALAAEWCELLPPVIL